MGRGSPRRELYSEAVHMVLWMRLLVILLIFVAMVGLVLPAAMGQTGETTWAYYLALGACLLILVFIVQNFLTLRVAVYRDRVVFGFGFFTKTLQQDSITACRVAKYSWVTYLGWGVRYAPGGRRAWSQMFAPAGIEIEVTEKGRKRTYFVSSKGPGTAGLHPHNLRQGQVSMIKAVIFDMDGVLTDSEPLYFEAINVVLAKHGHNLTEEENRAIIGSGVEDTWLWLIKRFRLPNGVAYWTARYGEAVVRLLGEKVIPSQGLYDLLSGLKSRGIRLGLASSAEGDWVEAVLGKLDISGYFEAVTAGEMVKAGKPAPDVYLATARKLKLDPARCLAIEDTPRGIEAAKSAGMTAVAVLTPLTAHLDLSRADHIVPTLDKFDYRWLNSEP